MKICVLVPSPDSLKQAGVRIRYRRIADQLKEAGHTLKVLPIQELAETGTFPDDVYLISKCYDVRALMVAALLSSEQKLVGLDLFDDYFSQASDSRFMRLRAWMRALVPSLDFILCSTAQIRVTAASLAPGLPVHVMNDPASAIDTNLLCTALEHKLAMVGETGVVNIAWFGIGDNPYFPVGLSDLVAFGGQLAALRGHGYDVHLSILTNERALSRETLASLARLPVPYTLEEWSEAGEAALLDRCLVAFLPVNAQRFSLVKSLNRAVSALTAGTQVLSAGYPLYEALSPFIYRDPAHLMRDLQGGELVLRPATLEGFLAKMEDWADGSAEAEGLAGFLMSLDAAAPAEPAAKPSTMAVVHGHDTLGDIHKFVQQLGGLSVGSPFSTPKLHFNLRFSFVEEGAGVALHIDEQHCARLGAGVMPFLGEPERIGGKAYRKLDIEGFLPDLSFPGAATGAVEGPLGFVASYGAVMKGIDTVLEALYPGCHHYVSELSKLPWHLDQAIEAQG